jgi:hypothetical protein
MKGEASQRAHEMTAAVSACMERTPQIYLHADLELKQRTLDRITPPEGRPGRYRAPDTLLGFLEGL